MSPRKVVIDPDAPVMPGLSQATSREEFKKLQAILAEQNRGDSPIAPLVAPFAELARERARVCAELPEFDLSGLQVDTTAFTEGQSLLYFLPPEMFAPAFVQAVTAMLPVLMKVFPALAEEIDRVRTAFGVVSGLAEDVFLAMVSEPEALDEIASNALVSADVLAFVAHESLRPVLQRVAPALAARGDLGLWRHADCPICGSRPDFAYLKTSGQEGEFLISKSGQLWFQCSMCSHHWRFLRAKCPACGNLDLNDMEVLTPEGREIERVYACLKCKSYFPCLDLTALEGQTDFAVAPLRLMHLDILAQERGYHPFFASDD